ncbi:transposon, En/Spm-like protein [Artemisia annua]|uniref:Transposon, En/Spm-like protein n=1 Tax=Artemisia annua TaxID=35608 RepID=A0A2U1PS12_ARTAN|nr:transposon, En/Spm-like protein [Artemisia annua]
MVTGSGGGTSQRSQSSVFNSSVPNRGNSQRSSTSGNSFRPNNGPRNNDNRRTSGGPLLVCEHCGFNGHTVDRCFKIIGYPADFGKNKRNGNNSNNQGTQNFNKRFVNNNNSVGSSFTSAFSDEQISKLLSLIKETSSGRQRSLTDEEMRMAHNYIILNCEELHPFIGLFDDFVRHTQPHIDEGGLESYRDKSFAEWLEKHVCERSDDSISHLKGLARGPLRHAWS